MYSTYPTISKTATPTVTTEVGGAPTYDDLVTALQLIEHATSPTHDDGAYHEAAHDLATQVLSRLPAASGDAIKPRPDWNKPTLTPREVHEMVLGLEKSVKAHGFQLMTGLKGELAIEPRPREGDDPRLLVGDYFTHQRSGARFAVSAITSREAGSTIELVAAPVA